MNDSIGALLYIGALLGVPCVIMLLIGYKPKAKTELPSAVADWVKIVHKELK